MTSDFESWMEQAARKVEEHAYAAQWGDMIAAEIRAMAPLGSTLISVQRAEFVRALELLRKCNRAGVHLPECGDGDFVDRENCKCWIYDVTDALVELEHAWRR